MIQSADRFARDWISAWNARDVQGILAHYALDEVEVRAPGMTDAARGRAALADHVGRTLTLMRGRRLELIAVAGGHGSATIIYSGGPARVVVETLEFADDGRVVRSLVQHAASWRPWQAVAATLRLWVHRARTRAELARLDDRMLRDIGYPALDADREAGLPFWKP